jgi:hypothetical protein
MDAASIEAMTENKHEPNHPLIYFMKEGGFLWMVCSAWILLRLCPLNPEAVTKEIKKTGGKKAYSEHPDAENIQERHETPRTPLRCL